MTGHDTTGSLWTFLRRPFVWNRESRGLRAFGIDFGPFALVVLRNGRVERDTTVYRDVMDR